MQTAQLGGRKVVLLEPAPCTCMFMSTSKLDVMAENRLPATRTVSATRAS